MPRNGSGTYQLPAGNPVVTGTPISSSTQNTTMVDVANALTTSVATDGQTPMTANLTMGNNKLTGLSAGTAAGDSVRYEDLATANQTQSFTFYTTAGTAPAFTLTPVPAIQAYAAGQRFNVTFNALGTVGTNTLAVSSLAAKSLKQYDELGIKQPAFIPSGLNTDVEYDGTDFILVSPLPPSRRLAPSFVNSGAMVAQRTTAGTLATSRVIGQCDNIGVWASGGAVSGGNIQQTTTGPGTSGYSCLASSVILTGSGQISHSIRMEARDAVKYKNKTVSFSVRVMHNVGSAINYTLVAKKPTVADTFTSTTIIATSGATSVLSATDTLLTFNNVAIGDVSNGLELEVQAVCGAVTTKAFNATEFYVAIEAAAGTYDAPDYERELAHCQRYLPVFNASTALDIVGNGSIGASSTGQITYFFKVPTRVIPTGAVVSAPSSFSLYSYGTITSLATSIVFSSAGLGSALLIVTGTATTYTIGYGCDLRSVSASGQIILTGCEL